MSKKSDKHGNTTLPKPDKAAIPPKETAPEFLGVDNTPADEKLPPGMTVARHFGPVAQTEHRPPAVAARFDFLKRQFGKRQGPDTRHERAKCEQAVKEYIAMGGDAADAKVLRALADNTYGTL